MAKHLVPPTDEGRIFEDSTWTELRDVDVERAVALLPVGAVEAHGPHLPLSTDRIIAYGMAKAGARALGAAGVDAWILPGVAYTAAPFAAAFPGSLDIRPETVTALIVDIARSLAAHGWRRLVIVNSHLDPTHLGSLYAAIEALSDSTLAVVFPDITRRRWAGRLTEEFKSGACHAGRYEGSMVLAERPDLVRDMRHELAPVDISLSDAIRGGLETFAAAGGDEAYFGDPAAATAEEGRETLNILGAIVAEAVLETY